MSEYGGRTIWRNGIEYVVIRKSMFDALVQTAEDALRIVRELMEKRP